MTLTSTSFVVLKSVSAGIAFASLLGVPAALAASSTSPTQLKTVAQTDASSGLTWMNQHAGAANQDWTGIAGYAVGRAPSSSNAVVNAMVGEVSKLKASTDYARFILALLAGAQDPHNFAGKNFVSALAAAQFKSGADVGKFADNINGTGTDLINSQAWSIIALEDAGGANYNRAAAATWLLHQQNADGGFGYSHTYSSSDPDDTASALVALRLLGYHATDPQIVKALHYLQTQQATDGGFENGATTSNSDSTGVVTDALLAYGISPLTWQQTGGNPVTSLLGYYDSKSGGFNYDNTGSSWSGVSAYSTRDSVIGLSAFLNGQSVYQRLHWTSLGSLNPYWENVYQHHGLWLFHHWYSWQNVRVMAVAGSYAYQLTPAWQTVVKDHGMKVNGKWESWDIHLATQAVVARYGLDTLHMNGLA